MRRALAIAALLIGAGAGCGGAAPAASCPVVDEEELAARIADEIYERLRRQGQLRPVGDEPTASHD